MTWKQFFSSSLGKKYVMGFTGFFLITFLIVHASVNSLIFFGDDGATFNRVAHFMSHNWVVRILELGLFAGIILHIVQGIIVWRQNAKARPVGYARNKHKAKSKWYSRSMGLLGTLILLFLIMHLAHFWVGTNPIVVVLYMIGLVSLGFHLLHGFQSAFQTFGINHKRYTPFIRGLGVLYTIVITALFALMPLAVHLKWI
jgi:succinate dehydrogenase / fumarate reductase, cytochrome b subunit